MKQAELLKKASLLNTGKSKSKVIASEIVNISVSKNLRSGFTASAKAKALEVKKDYSGNCQTIAHLIAGGKTEIEALENLAKKLDTGFSKSAIDNFNKKMS